MTGDVEYGWALVHPLGAIHPCFGGGSKPPPYELNLTVRKGFGPSALLDYRTRGGGSKYCSLRSQHHVHHRREVNLHCMDGPWSIRFAVLSCMNRMETQRSIPAPGLCPQRGEWI